MAKAGLHSSKKPAALKMRTVQRLGTKEIARRTGVPLSTLHYWLKDHPLSKAERSAIISKSPRYSTPKKTLSEGGLDVSTQRTLLPRDLGLLGESAAQMYLALRGFVVARPAADGDVVDLYVRKPGGERVAFIQARVAAKPPSRNGLPTISLRRYRKGQSNRFVRGDFHFLVGFCRGNGKCYVYSFDEVEHHANSVTVREDACDAFHKLDAWLDGIPSGSAAAAA